MFTSS